MKKFFLIVAALISFPLCAEAGIIGNLNLQVIYSAPTGSVSFPPGTVSGNYYLDYDVSLNGGTAVEAFCVENVGAPSGTLQYTLLTIDSGLSAFGLDATRYMAAAWIADYYNSTNSSSEDLKAAAQIAVWEVIFDYDNGFNLAGGGFKSSVYITEAKSIWDLKPSEFLASSEWTLAVNPTVLAGDITVYPYQNYIVHHPVPIPSTVLLLGVGLLGMIGLRRKFGT
jgi:hypothetical protein